jgi:hypothetical protein
MTTKELLEAIDDFIQQQDDIRVCAKIYNDIAEILDKLYEGRIKPNSSSLLPSLQQKVAGRITTIAHTRSQNEELQSLIEQDKVYEQQEQTLLDEHGKLQKRLQKIEDLKKKNVELKKPENQFDYLDKETQNIHLENDKIIKELIDILDRVNELLNNNTTKMDERLRDVIQQTKKNLTLLNTQSKEIISCLDTNPLDLRSKALNKDLEDLIFEYNRYVKKIHSIDEELKKVEEKHSNIVNQYKEQYETDTMIYGNLDERGNVEDYINANAKEIETFFQQFEKMLNELKEKRQRLKLPEIYEKQYDKEKRSQEDKNDKVS